MRRQVILAILEPSIESSPITADVLANLSTAVTDTSRGEVNVDVASPLRLRVAIHRSRLELKMRFHR
jgi:hypothetical protein